MEVQARFKRLDRGIAFVEGRSILKHPLPGLGIELKDGQWSDRLHRIGMGKIVHRLIDGKLLQLRLLGGKRFGGGLVGAVGREPQLVTKRQHVVVNRHEVDGALALSNVAILFVVANADDDPHETEAQVHIGAQSAECSLSGILIHIVDPVFDVVRRRYLLHFQLRLGSIQFGAHGGEDYIVVGLCLFLLRECPGAQHSEREQRPQNASGYPVGGECHRRHCFAPAPFPELASSAEGGDRMGGRLRE